MLYIFTFAFVHGQLESFFGLSPPCCYVYFISLKWPPYVSPTPELHYCELCKGQKISEGNCFCFSILQKSNLLRMLHPFIKKINHIQNCPYLVFGNHQLRNSKTSITPITRQIDEWKDRLDFALAVWKFMTLQQIEGANFYTNSRVLSVR